MTDRISEQRRSWNMSRIRSKGTEPELRVRSELHRMGYRFRLHKRELPGFPDIVLNKHHTVIFIDGCFWHRHPSCTYAYTPKSRVEFWNSKFKRNMKRDKVVRKELEALGWKVITIWECETSSSDSIREILFEHLSKTEESR